jgi:hypothetical protein
MVPLELRCVSTRYIHRENRTYLVDPGERRVIEEIE